MHFDTSKETSSVSMTLDGKKSQLKDTSLEKNLGIWCSLDLKPSEHVAKAVSKYNQILGIIRRTFTFMDISNYETDLHPFSQAAFGVWHCNVASDTAKR